jgi:tetratricopeptide (TPR) repeat protein
MLRLLMIPLLCAGFCHAQAARPGARELFLQARQHFEKQQWEAARAAAGRALELDPGLADAEVMLGLIDSVKGEFGPAERHFRRALSIQPDNHYAKGYLGSTCFQLKRYAEAARLLKEVVAADPGNATANYNLGLVSLAQGKPVEALPFFQKVLSANPADIAALTGILECRLLLKQPVAVRETVSKLERLLPPSDPSLLRVASLLLVHEQYEPATAILERVRQAHPESFDVNYNLALGYVRSGKFERAAQLLEPFLAGPNAAEANSLTAQVRDRLQLKEQALAAYQKAAELEPANEEYRFGHASAVLQYLSIDGALAGFSKATSDFPKSWRMKVGLGSALFLAGRYEECARALLDAVRVEPRAAPAYYLLGKVYESAGQQQTTIRETFKAYLKTRPRDAWAFYHYGVMQYLEQEARSGTAFEPAKTQLKTALSLKPDFAEAHLQMGIIAQAEGNLQEAARSLEKAVGANPDLPTPHYRLAQVYQRMGDAGKSRTEFQLFSKLKERGAEQERQAVLRSLGRDGK